MKSEWKWDGKYPVRCEIVDVTGQEVMPGIEGNTPDVSKPHVGIQGIAFKDGEYGVHINLDNGSELMGYECWWRPIGPVPDVPLSRQDVLKAIDDEPEYPGEVPAKLKKVIKRLIEVSGPEDAALTIARLSVAQTKRCITDRIYTLKAK